MNITAIIIILIIVLFIGTIVSIRGQKKGMVDTSTGKATLPLYKCFKIVQAVKIGAIHHNDGGGANLIPDNYLYNVDYDTITVSREYVEKHKPQKGGYYVVYKDNYESFSPSKAFEDGYSRIDE